MPHGVGHHHHVHHHHHHVGFRHRYHHRHHYYAGPYVYGYRRRPLTWVIFSIFVTVAVVLSTTLTLRYTASDDSDDNGLTYGPTDTRIISVNRVLCQTVNFEMDALASSSSVGYTVYFYSLSSPPQVMGSETYTEQPPFIVQNYKTYISFMPKGSSFDMSACVLDPDQPDFTFYLVKGKQNYENWKDDYSSFEDTASIATSCEAGNDTYSYSVDEDNFFYLIFRTYYASSYYDTINISITYHQRQYELDNVTILDSCSLDSADFFGTCSVGLPLSGSTTTLLKVSANDDTTTYLSDSVSVGAYCGTRVWMYVLLSLIILGTFVSFFVALAICLYCVCIRRKKREAAAAAAAGDANARAEQSVNTPLLQDGSTAPPFTDPVYPQASASTSYGSNYYAPPAYKE